MFNLRGDIFSNWGQISEWLFYLAVFLLPIWTLPLTIFPVELNKSYLTSFLVILAGVLYLSFILRGGRLSLSKNLLWFFSFWFDLSFCALKFLFVFSPILTYRNWQ